MILNAAVSQRNAKLLIYNDRIFTFNRRFQLKNNSWRISWLCKTCMKGRVLTDASENPEFISESDIHIETCIPDTQNIANYLGK